MWEVPKTRGYLILGSLQIRILLFRVVYEGPLFSETPICGSLPVVRVLAEGWDGRRQRLGAGLRTEP